jgi:TonB family protein
MAKLIVIPAAVCNSYRMLSLTLSPLLLAASLTQEAETTNAAKVPVSKSLEERCPSGFAQPDVYQHLTREPVMSYPTKALRMNMEGQVGIALIVGCDGVVKECGILSSSGHRMLDEHACQIMAKVAFVPLRDESGQAREGVYTTSLTFSL